MPTFCLLWSGGFKVLSLPRPSTSDYLSRRKPNDAWPIGLFGDGTPHPSIPKWLCKTGLRLTGGVSPRNLSKTREFFQLSFTHIMQHYGLLRKWFGPSPKESPNRGDRVPRLLPFPLRSPFAPNAPGARAPGFQHPTKLIGPCPPMPS